MHIYIYVPLALYAFVECKKNYIEQQTAILPCILKRVCNPNLPACLAKT